MLDELAKVPKDSQPSKRFLGMHPKWLASLEGKGDDDVVHLHYVGAIFSRKSAQERLNQHLHSLGASGASLLWTFVGGGVCGADAKPVAEITASRIIFTTESICNVRVTSSLALSCPRSLPENCARRVVSLHVFSRPQSLLHRTLRLSPQTPPPHRRDQVMAQFPDNCGLVACIAEAVGMNVCCGMSHQFGLNQVGGGGLWGGRVFRCNCLVQARAELYMKEHPGVSYEAARKVIRALPVATLAAFDPDILQWSKDIKQPVMGPLISAGCRWAGQRAWCLVDKKTGVPIKIVSRDTKGAVIVSDDAVFALKGKLGVNTAWCLLGGDDGKTPIALGVQGDPGVVHVTHDLVPGLKVKTAWCRVGLDGKTPIALGVQGDPGVVLVTHDLVPGLKSRQKPGGKGYSRGREIGNGEWQWAVNFKIGKKTLEVGSTFADETSAQLVYRAAAALLKRDENGYVAFDTASSVRMQEFEGEPLDTWTYLRKSKSRAASYKKITHPCVVEWLTAIVAKMKKAKQKHKMSSKKPKKKTTKPAKKTKKPAKKKPCKKPAAKKVVKRKKGMSAEDIASVLTQVRDATRGADAHPDDTTAVAGAWVCSGVECGVGYCAWSDVADGFAGWGNLPSTATSWFQPDDDDAATVWCPCCYHKQQQKKKGEKKKKKKKQRTR